MYKKLARLLIKNEARLSYIEHMTGVTKQTMRNIIADPEGKRQKTVINALNEFFKSEEAK